MARSTRVDIQGSNRSHALAGLVAVVAHRPVPVLIDPEAAHGHLVDVGQEHHGRAERGLDQPPGHRVGAGNLQCRPPGCDDCGNELVLEPARRAGEPADLDRRPSERPSRARRLGAEPASLGPPELHRPGHRDVAHPRQAARVYSSGDHPARRAARWLRRLHPHPSTTPRQGDRVDHTVSGQVEDRARSIPPRTRRLVHARGPLARWISRQDPSQQDHEPSRHDDAPNPIATNREEPFNVTH